MKAPGGNPSQKEWYHSFDAGLALGGDIMISKKIGFNVDVRYHVNIETENPSTPSLAFKPDRQVSQVSCGSIAASNPTFLFQENLRYYF